MTAKARDAARARRCDRVVDIGSFVSKLDERYYREVFATDPILAGCLQAPRELGRAPVTAGSLDTSSPGEAQPLPPVDYKSPATALGLSLGITATGALLTGLAFASDNDHRWSLAFFGIAALTVGPSAGHVYARDPWSAGLKVRLLAPGITLIGSLIACPALLPPGGNGGCAEKGLLVMAGAGLVTFAGAAAYDIATASGSARTYNRNHRVDITIAPTVGREPGLAFVGRF